MAAPLDAILDTLGALVACDTRNPPRAIDADHPIVAAVRAALPDFDLTVEDLGDGSVNMLAKRGEPAIVFNCHLDIVPDNERWTSPPLELVRGEDRAVGLGACDIKGAAACMIEAARRTNAPAAFLFTTDEEHGRGRCVRTFLEKGPAYTQAVVAEPTDGAALLSHRGVGSYTFRFVGEPGHASGAAAREGSAVHRAARFIVEALAWAEETEGEGGVLPGCRLNVGRIEGGDKPNMIAASCTLRAGARPGPQYLVSDVADELWRMGKRHGVIERATTFAGEALGSSSRARAFALEHDLTVMEAADFWTEAALFAGAGIPAIVLGSGDIAQAHTADEFVIYDSLARTFEAYARILKKGV